MILVPDCTTLADACDDQIVDVQPSARHRSLLTSYLLNSDRGHAFVLEMMINDIHSFMDLGAMQQAADVAVALQLFLMECPDPPPAPTSGEDAQDPIFCLVARAKDPVQ